jgi:hypothetical protein
MTRKKRLISMPDNVTVERSSGWDAAQNSRFHELWTLGVPLAVIAILMNRTAASIQTKASRESLPEREIPDYAKNHRQKWTQDHIYELDNLVRSFPEGPDFYSLERFAKQIGRTLDAITGRIQEQYGSAALARLADDYTNDRFRKPVFRAGPPGAPPNTNRRCIVSHCRRWFWAKDKTRDWKCGRCREEHKHMTDNDFDYWIDGDTDI